MSILLMLKEGGSLGIDTIGNLPIDEDIDLLPDASAAFDFNPQFLFWVDSGHALLYLNDADTLLLIDA